MRTYKLQGTTGLKGPGTGRAALTVSDERLRALSYSRDLVSTEESSVSPDLTKHMIHPVVSCHCLEDYDANPLRFLDPGFGLCLHWTFPGRFGTSECVCHASRDIRGPANSSLMSPCYVFPPTLSPTFGA